MRAYFKHFLRKRVKKQSLPNAHRSKHRQIPPIWVESFESRIMLDGSPFGLASFTPLGDNPVIVAGPTGLNGAPLMDLNHDGVGDMIVEYGNGIGIGNSTVASVSALLVLADGSSTEYHIAQYTIPSSAPLPIIDQVLVADFNGDGQPDVAILRNDGSSVSTHKWIDIFMGQPDGTFTEPTAPIALNNGSVSISTPTMTLFDQNGDGKTDIFLEDGTKFTAYLGNGDGTFASPVVSDFQTFQFPLSLNKLSTVTNASFQQDLTGDGIPDLVVSGEVPTFARTGTEYALYVFKGQASGKYNLTTPSFSETTDNLTLQSVQQLSSDNKPDIVAYSSTAGPDVASSIFVFRNNGNGTFTQSFHSPTFANNLPTIAIGLNGPQQPLLTPDLTGDGVNDMILVEGGLGTNNNVTLHIEKNNGNAGFTETQQIPFVSVGKYDNSGLVEDVDGDGLPDLVVYRITADSGTVGASIYFNHGGGVFDATGLVPTPSSSVTPGRAPGLADFNGDGKLDLIYNSSSGVEVLLNTTGRAFGPGIDTVLTQGGPNLVRYQIIPPDPLLDYTGDKLPDLLSYDGDSLGILASTGDGHFTALQPSAAFGGANHAGFFAPSIATDINHDGKIDLIWGPLPDLAQFDENPPSIIVDINGATAPADTAGSDMATARDLGTLTGPIALDQFINTTWVNGNTLLNLNDFYKFTLASPQVVRITAVAATGTVSLSLKDSSGTGIAGSNDPLPVVDATLAAGTYYVAVGNSDAVDTHYRLDIQFPTQLPSIGVNQDFNTILNGQTTSVDFGSVLITTTDTHKDFTIRNDGLATLDLNAITFPTGFTLSGTIPVSTLAPGASETLSVVMNTSAAGEFSGNITIPSTDLLTSNFVFPVSGSVTGPAMTDLSGTFASSPTIPSTLAPGQSAPLSFDFTNAGPSDADGTYSVAFKLEKGAPQLGKGDVTAGTTTGAILLAASATTASPLDGTFTIPANLAPGTYYLAATITDGGNDIDNNAADKTFFSGPITIVPPPTHLVFIEQPVTTIAGQVIPTLSIQVLDAANHLVTVDNSTVMLSLVTPAGATLNGTTSVHVINGAAHFDDLSIMKTGSYMIRATDGNLNLATSKVFTITPDTSTSQLAIFSQPTTALVGKPLTPAPVIAIEDQYHNVIVSNTSSVALSIFDGPGGSVSGTTIVSAIAGKATFKNVALSGAGDYTLQASDNSLAITTPVHFSDNISVARATTALAKPVVHASFIFGQTITVSGTLKSNAPAGIPFTGDVTLTDQNNDVFTPVAVSAGGAFKFTLSNLPGNVTAYSFTLNYPGDINHTAIASPSFNVKVNQAATTTTLTTSATSLVSGQSLTLTAAVATTSGESTARSGTITFKDNGAVIQVVNIEGNSSASWVINTPAVGLHHYTAVYSGDTNFKSSTSVAKAVTIKKDSTSITLTPSLASPILENQTFNLNVHVTVMAPGMSALTGIAVTIKDNGTLLATLNLDESGNATSSAISYSTGGTHSFTATYAGDLDTLTVISSILKLTVT